MSRRGTDGKWKCGGPSVGDKGLDSAAEARGPRLGEEREAGRNQDGLNEPEGPRGGQGAGGVAI